MRFAYAVLFSLFSAVADNCSSLCILVIATGVKARNRRKTPIVCVPIVNHRVLKIFSVKSVLHYLAQTLLITLKF